MKSLWHAFEARLAELLAWVESFAHTPYGAQALFVLAFLESSVFPVPPDALLIPLCLAFPERAFGFATLCSIGSVLGGMAGYALGRYGGRPILVRLFRREWIAAVEEKYDRYNAWATAVGGFTPLPYKLFTVSGGAFRIHFGIFVVASVLSRSARFFLVAAVLYWFGPPAKQFIERHLGLLSIAFVILLIAGFWFVGRAWRRTHPPRERES
ncbi:MAG: YqaA family protein [Thermoanaerobaculia bacterium]